MTIKSTLIGATAIALALTSFDLRPAAAAPQGGAAIAKQTVNADEIGAARKHRRGYRGAPLAAFGAIAGTIAGIAAANARRFSKSTVPRLSGSTSRKSHSSQP